MNRRSFLCLALGALGLPTFPAIAQDRISLESARKDESLRQDYLERVGKEKGIQKIVYDHYYGESSADLAHLIGSYQDISLGERSAMLDQPKDFQCKPVFTILDRRLFGLGNVVSSIYVVPSFFKQGYRIYGGSARLPLDEVDESDHLQKYRVSSGRDVAFSLEHQHNLRAIQARGYPEHGFGYGSLSDLSRYDSRVIYDIVRLEAHMASFQNNYQSINHFLALEVLNEMCDLTKSLDKSRPRSAAVRHLLYNKVNRIRSLTGLAVDRVRELIGQ